MVSLGTMSSYKKIADCRSIWYASFLYAVEYGDISNITNGFKDKLQSINKSSIIPLIAQFSSKEED